MWPVEAIYYKKPLILIYESTENLLYLVCHKKLRKCIKIRKCFWSLLVQTPDKPPCISSKIHCISKARLKRVKTYVLQTVICFVTHCCVYIAKLLPQNKARVWMNSLTVQPRLWKVTAHIIMHRLNRLVKWIMASDQDLELPLSLHELNQWWKDLPFLDPLCFSCLVFVVGSNSDSR